jgi:hypothetical protein
LISVDASSPEPANAPGTESSKPPEPAIVASKVSVRGFRCLRDTTLDLEPTTTYLIGENNAGKTSLIMAIASAVGSYRAVSDDLHRPSDGGAVEAAEIDLWLVPANGARFSQTARQQLAGNVHPLGGSEMAAFRTTLTSSQEGAHLSTDRVFLQPDGQVWVPSTALFRPESLRLLDAQLLDASRDLVREAANRGSGWGRVLSDLQIPEPEEGCKRQGR